MKRLYAGPHASAWCVRDVASGFLQAWVGKGNVRCIYVFKSPQWSRPTKAQLTDGTLSVYCGLNNDGGGALGQRTLRRIWQQKAKSHKEDMPADMWVVVMYVMLVALVYIDDADISVRQENLKQRSR